MTAKFIPIGEPAHDAERHALHFLVQGLPDDYTVYGNPWLVDRNGGVFELDAVVVTPHGIYIVEIKSFRGRIEGTDSDWYIPNPIKSPLRLNHLTAQKLKDRLKRDSHDAGQAWVQGFVFLSATTDVGVKGPASDHRVWTRKNILAALQDPALLERLSGRRSIAPTQAADAALLGFFTGSTRGPPPVRRLREYDLITTLDHQDSYVEVLGKNRIDGTQRILRRYVMPELASAEQREAADKRARWEAQVLGRIGRIEGIISADPAFTDDGNIILPLEAFEGITLTTWLQRYGPKAKKGMKSKTPAGFDERASLWLRIAQAIREVHRQGVIHRLLRPEVILVEDHPKARHFRITGFDLAKQTHLGSSVTLNVSLSSIGDDRLIFAAPEVIAAFSSAEPASDQFSLGALLGLILLGEPLFENTRALMAARRLLVRVRDRAPRIPLTIDEAVTRMLSLSIPERYAKLEKAISVVREAHARPTQRDLPTVDTKKPLDIEDLGPQTRIGPDYEIITRLGHGGMSVVYAARHLASGRTRALKIARPNDAAEEALRGEYDALSKLDHPNVVRVVDLSKMIEQRLTLVMERVGGTTLRSWLTAHPTPDAPTQRRLAEDLLAGLEYLENQGVTHKDLKPDNLLVDDGHLTIIDFSLASMPPDAAYGGTPLYGDPSSPRFSHATDRFAAALCLFELYAGRHAFDGKVPEPNQTPTVTADDIDPPGLAPFFQKALHPVPEQRFGSCRAMRDALLMALGADAPSPAPTPTDRIDVTTPLRATGLSRRAINALAKSRVQTVGELLALPESQVENIHAIGTKTTADILAFQRALRTAGLVATVGVPHPVEPPVHPELIDEPEPTERLPLQPGLLRTLTEAGHRTVGAVARLTRSDLKNLPGIGRQRLAEIIEALYAFAEHTPEPSGPHTLDRIWDAAARALTERQRVCVERTVGICGEPEPLAPVADDLNTSKSMVSNEASTGLERLDRAALTDVQQLFDALLDSLAVIRVDDLGARLEDEWPAGMVPGAGLVRLLVRIGAGRAQLVPEVRGVDGPVVAKHPFDRATLDDFMTEVVRLSQQWPLVEQDSARRTLSRHVPGYAGDPYALALRLASDVRYTAAGHLFTPPMDAAQSIAMVLDQARDPMSLDDLRTRVEAMFGEDTPFPSPDHLVEVLHKLDCRVQGDQVLPGKTSSVFPPPPLHGDALPDILARAKSPEEELKALLTGAARSRGFRMLVTPPERHHEIGKSVAKALDATWLSFDDAFFEAHGADIGSLERAERFIAQRDALTEAAEETLFKLLEEHGQAGRRLVLGDTALFGLCEATDLPRRLYDETLSGSHGFWVLLVPGVIHKRQPRFNEGPALWHLEGATFPLLSPLP